MASQTGPQHDLRRASAEVVRLRWIAPSPPPKDYRIPLDKLDELARTVLDTMLTRAFRMTPFPGEQEYGQLLRRVRHWMRRGQPIRVRIGYGPMKNLNAARHSRADWSEFFALCHLCAWHNKVAAIYPPGLRIKIVFDDATIRMANRHDRQHMQSYMQSVRELIRVMGYDTILPKPMRQSSFAWSFWLGLIYLGMWRVRRWDRDPAHREQIERMDEYADRNLVLPAGLGEEERRRAARKASYRYRVYWETLQLSRVTRWGKSIVAMYLDGSQHHIRQPVALHLTTVGKGQVTQPWQGEGALLDNGNGQLVPVVLTQGRRDKWTMKEIDGLDLVPMDGFSSIPVCWEEPQAGEASHEMASPVTANQANQTR